MKNQGVVNQYSPYIYCPGQSTSAGPGGGINGTNYWTSEVDLTTGVLVDYLHENQQVMNTSTPRGSGVKAVRGVNAEQNAKMEEYLSKARQFEMLCGEKSEQLYERYIEIK